MALPAFVQAGAGFADTTGTGTVEIASGVTVGNIIILHGLADVTGELPNPTTITGIENLAGTASAMTFQASVAVGSPQSGNQFVYVGRATATSVSVLLTTHVGGGDHFTRLYEFSGVTSGTTFAAIAENGGAASAQASGTSDTIDDVGVTTNAADRLAVNLIAVNDDNPLAAFSGQTGGTWVEPVEEFASATGTDGCIGIQVADMAAAGTINGGSLTMAASDGWSVFGFAFIPAAVAAPTSLAYDPRRVVRNILLRR
jgi:hypothetical protein